MNRIKLPKSVWMQAVLCLVLLVFWISSCSPARVFSSTPFETVCDRVAEAAGSEYYPAMEASRAKKYISLDDSDASQWALYRTGDAYNAQELLVVFFETDEQRDALEQKLAERIQSQVQTYAGYAPAQEAMAKSALVDLEGNYALYYAGDDARSVQEAFLKALQEGDGQ